MDKGNEQGSEVARLLAQISAEYEAAQQGLTGLSSGVAQHKFITARMEHMGQMYDELQEVVGGENTAIALIAERLASIQEAKSSSVSTTIYYQERNYGSLMGFQS